MATMVFEFDVKGASGVVWADQRQKVLAIRYKVEPCPVRRSSQHFTHVFELVDFIGALNVENLKNLLAE